MGRGQGDGQRNFILLNADFFYWMGLNVAEMNPN